MDPTTLAPGVAPATPPDPDLLQRINRFMQGASQTIARTPFSSLNLPIPGVPQPFGENRPTPAQATSPVATSGFAGAVRSAVPTRFANTAQGIAEGLPRMVGDVGASMVAPPLMLADMGLSGYGGAKDAGAGTGKALLAGGLQAGLGAAFGPVSKFMGNAPANLIGSRAASAAASFFDPAIGDVAGKALSNVVGKEAASKFAGSTAGQVAKFMGSQAGIAGVGEAQNFTQDTVEHGIGQAAKDAITPENIFGLAAGQAAFLPMTAGHMLAESGHSAPQDPQTRILNQFLEQKSNPTPVAPVKTSLDTNAPVAPKSEAKVAQSTFDQVAGLGSASTVGPHFSLVNPFGVDFSSQATMSPPLILDRILAGEITPTNAESNAPNHAIVKILKDAFVDQSALSNGYVDMNQVGHLANLADLQARGLPLTAPQMAAWAKLSPKQQTGAQVAAKILNDPVGTLGGPAPDTENYQGNTVEHGGLNPGQWEVQPLGPDMFSRFVTRSAGNLMTKWNRPITSVEDAASLVHAVNDFTGYVGDFLNQNGFGPALQEQMAKKGLFTPITKESLQEKYDIFRGEYLSNPDGESAARTLQWVKNQILLHAQSAKEAMVSVPGFGEQAMQPKAGIAERDLAAETAFKGALDKVPPPMQEVLTNQYLRSRKEKAQASGNANWSLTNYRSRVAEAINTLRPEDLEKLKTLPMTEPGPVTITSKEERRPIFDKNKYLVEQERQQGTLPGIAPKVESGYKTGRTKAVTMPLFESQAPAKVDMSQVRTVLDTIPVNLTDREGRPIRTNLGKVVFEPLQDTEASWSARQLKNPEVQQNIRDSLYPNETTEEENVGKRENNIIARNFTGTLVTPSETLAGMSPRDFQRAVVAQLDNRGGNIDRSKVWTNRMDRFATLSGKTREQVIQDGSGEAWLRNFARIASEGTMAERRQWADQNGFQGQKWGEVTKSMISADAGKRTLWKARMLGLQPKIGVTADTIKQELSPSAEPVNRPVKTDFKGFVRDSLLNRGYQPEVAENMTSYVQKMADHFGWLDNVNFATLTDTAGVADAVHKQLKVLGMHLPAETMVGGKAIRNPIIAAAEQDLVGRGGYGPLNTFFKLTVLPHEAYHDLYSKIVNDPNFKPLNEDMQTIVDSVHSMEKNGSSMSPDERAMSMTAFVDLMIPRQYARDANGKLIPEVQGFINAASADPKEWAASMFQFATAGLGAKLAEGEKGGADFARVARDGVDALSWFSPDTISFLRGQYRYSGDILGSLQQLLDDPDYRASKGLQYDIAKERPYGLRAGDQNSDVINRQTWTKDGKGELSSPGPVPSLPRPAAKAGSEAIPIPPTASVGVRTRSAAEAALRIANTPWTPQSGVTPRVEEPSYVRVLRQLSQVHPEIENAMQTVRQIISNMQGGSLTQPASIDLSDVKGTKSLMSSLGGEPDFGDEGAMSAFKNPVDIALQGTEAAKKTQRAWLMRMFAPNSLQGPDMQRRGYGVVEDSRQNGSRLWSNARSSMQFMYDSILQRSQKTGSFGRKELDPNSGYARFLQAGLDEGFNGPVSQALQKLALVQQRQGGIDLSSQAPSQLENGLTIQQVVADAVKGLPKEQAAFVVSAVKDMNKVSMAGQAKILDAKTLKFNGELGLLAMKMNPQTVTTAKSAMEHGQLVMAAARGDAQAMDTLKMRMAAKELSPEFLQAALPYAQHNIATLKALTATFKQQGQFLSERRFGQHVISWTPNDWNPGDPKGGQGFKTAQEAKDFVEELIATGIAPETIKYLDKNKEDIDTFGMSDIEGVEGWKKVALANEQAKMDAILKADPVNGPKLVAELSEQFGLQKSFNNYATTNGLQKLTNFKRKFAPGREYINPVATMNEYAASVARGTSISNGKVNHALYQQEMKMAGLNDIAADQDAMFKSNLTPTPETAKAVVAGGTAYFIALDLARSLIDSTTPGTIGLPLLHRETGSLPKSLKLLKDGMTETARNIMDTKAFNASADRGKFMTESSLAQAQKGSVQDRRDVINHFLRKANDDGVTTSFMLQDTLGTDTTHMNLGTMGREGVFSGTKAGDIASSPFYNVSKMLLKTHSFLPTLANRFSLHAALGAAYDQGLRGDAMYNRAMTLYDQMSIAPGKMNKSPILAHFGGSEPGLGGDMRRSAVAQVSMMQQFGLTSTFSMLHMMRDAAMQTPGLTQQQRVNAGKAAVTSVLTNVSLAGALGLPGLGIAYKLYNGLFHKDAEAATREALQGGFNSLFGTDEESGHLFADTVMNGLANRLTGLDFAGRSGVSSLFGIGPSNDASMWDVAGGGVSIIPTLYQGLSDVTAGKPWLGMKEIAPHSLKPFVEMSGNYKQFGDMRLMDQNNNLLMKPNAAQAIGYALGWQPARVREVKQEQRLQTTSQDNYEIGREAQIAQHARNVIHGQPQSVLQEAYSRQFQPGFDPKSFIDSVLERAADMQTQKDPMSEGTALNAPSQEAIGSTFDNPRQSEVARVLLKAKLGATLGGAFGAGLPNQQEFLEAALVDQLRQQRGMSRPDAQAWAARLMGHFPGQVAR